MCAHMRVRILVGENVQEWTLVPTAAAARDGLSVHLVTILSLGRIKVDFRGVGRNIERRGARKKNVE